MVVCATNHSLQGTVCGIPTTAAALTKAGNADALAMDGLELSTPDALEDILHALHGGDSRALRRDGSPPAGLEDTKNVVGGFASYGANADDVIAPSRITAEARDGSVNNMKVDSRDAFTQTLMEPFSTLPVTVPSSVRFIIKQAALAMWSHFFDEEANLSLSQSPGKDGTVTLKSRAFFDIGELVLPLNGRYCAASLSKYQAPTSNDMVVDGTAKIQETPSVWKLPTSDVMSNVTVADCIVPATPTFRGLGSDNQLFALEFTTPAVVNFEPIYVGDVLHLDRPIATQASRPIGQLGSKVTVPKNTVPPAKRQKQRQGIKCSQDLGIVR